MTYLMWKRGTGFRVGTSRTYTNGQAKAMFGPAHACNGEGGDAVWVIGTHSSEAEARLHEAVLAARYGLPTLPFSAPPATAARTAAWSGDQALIDRLFATLDTEKAGFALLADEGLSFDYPHHVASGHTGSASGSPRRRLSVVSVR